MICRTQRTNKLHKVFRYIPNRARMASCLIIISLVMYASRRIWSRKSPDISGMPQRTTIITIATKFCGKKKMYMSKRFCSEYTARIFMILLPRIQRQMLIWQPAHTNRMPFVHMDYLTMAALDNRDTCTSLHFAMAFEAVCPRENRPY